MKAFLKAALIGVMASAAVFTGAVYVLDRSGAVPMSLTKALFRRTPEYLSCKEALSDAREFFFRLERVHPEHTFKLGPEGYSKLKQGTEEEIREKCGKEDRLRVRDFAYLLKRTAAAIGDGHTLLRYTRDIDTNDVRRRFPPFALANKDGKLIISHAPGGEYAGAEILSLNGVPLEEFIRPVIDRLSGETYKFKLSQFERDQWFWWDFSGLLEGLQSFDVTLRRPDGKVIKASLETVGPESIPIGGMSSQGSGASLSIFYKNRIGWLNYASFDYSEQQVREIKGAFKRLKDEGIRDLVINLSGNGGGNSRMGDLIFSHISTANIVQSSGKIKVSEEFLKLYPQLEKLRRYNGSLVNMGTSSAPYTASELLFEGKVYLLVDNGSYSSSNLFAAAFRDYKLGKIIGYETGEPPIAYGNVVNLTLPNSGLNYGISACKYFPPKPRPGDDKHGVIPDVPLNDKLLRPYGGRVQAFVLDYIVRERKRKGA